ncbi:MAG: hypothetical protein HUJ31_09050 [Pseudomonadales bacterium]|nr:hypothetical protein [Pseudomonadales bacterium]
MQHLLFIGILCFVVSCTVQHAQMPLEESDCVEIGIETPTSLCWAYRFDYESNYYLNEVFLLKDGRRIEAVGMGDGAEINDMVVSPSRMYAAVEEDGGEGHPYLSIMTLEEVRQGKEPRYTAGYDPYPGSLWELRWQGDTLIFSTDRDVETETGDVNSYEIIWSLDPETGKLEQVGEPRPLQ